MTNITLYGMDISPPVRACLLTLNALGLPFEYKIVDLFKLEHCSEEFIKMNPQRTVPVLDDDDIWIWDSHAICSYLVDKYGKTDELYPKNLAKRAVVNQRLFFDASILFMSLRNISVPCFHRKITVVPKEKTNNVLEGYELVEEFLKEAHYLTGKNVTIADFCCGATVSSMAGIIPINPAKYPRTLAWLARLQQIPYYEKANGNGAKAYIDLLKNALTDIQYE